MFESFHNRSGRVISLGRAVLATVFLLAIWIDPSQPTLAPSQAYLFLFLYVLIATTILTATWNNWWLDAKLALPAHLLDIAVFSIIVLVTDGYTSPFFTFFVFLLLSSTIRWGWRETTITAGVVIVLFYASGVVALLWDNSQFDATRFAIRGAHLLVLSLISIWFGVNQQERRQDHWLSEKAVSAEPLIEEWLRHLAAALHIERAILAWWENEEPWVNVARLEGGLFEQARFGPCTFDPIVEPEICARPFLFEAGVRQVLQERYGKARLLSVKQAVNPKLASQFRIHKGLAFPVASSSYGGVVFALDVPGLCAHDLKAAAKLSLEISSALERTSSMALSQQSSEARTRLELARDLHDSIVQLLAGTSLRLEAIKTAAASGQDVGAEIEALLLELAQEQKEVRSFISNLRTCGGVATPRDIAAGICQLTERLAQQWRIRCELDTGTETMSCSAALEHNLHQLIREGIANAVKHGGAQRVVIKIRSDPKAVHLEIADTGAGFRPEANICLAKVPQSLEDRVQSLGGHLAVSASDKGAKVSITLAREIRT